MKSVLFIFCSIFLSTILVAQEFPSPTNFAIEVCYNWPSTCDEGYEPTDTVYYYTFDEPDTSGTDAILEGYNLYYNDTLMEYFTTPYYEAVTYGEGDYYVTAVYSDPTGESAPSNVVYGEGFLLSNDKYQMVNGVKIYPNPLPITEPLQIDSRDQVIYVSAYTISGKQVFNTENNTVHFTMATKGIYLLKIETETGIAIKKVIVE